MTDLKNPRVLEVVEGRDTVPAMALWEALPEGKRSQVEAGVMDKGAKFVAAPRLAAPKVAIVHDPFHVAKHLNEAVDHTRFQKPARLAEKGDESLKKTRYLWLHGTVPEQHKATFAELLEMNLKTSQARLYQEQTVEFLGHADATSGERFFTQWYRTIMRSHLDDMLAPNNQP
jgi:transposase